MIAERNKRIATRDLHHPTRLIFFFVLPALLLYLVFFVWPMLRSMYLSLFWGSPERGNYTYVGLGNFIRLARDENFWICVRHNLWFVLAGGSGTLVLALAVAVGLTHCGRGRSFFRVVFLFPNVMAAVAVAILWSFVYNPSFGLVNGALRSLGMPSYARAWLGEPGLALASVIFIHIWMGAGFYIVLFYAGLLRIPQDFIEAARIDGATAWQEFLHVRLPLLSEIMRIAAIYVVIGGLNVFALVHLVNDGMQNKYNNVLLTYLYQQGFPNGNFGYACAIAVAMLFLVLFSAFVVNLFFREKAVEL